MKNLNRILFLVLLIEVSMLYVQSSFALFSDTSASTANTFTASTEFAVASPTLTPTPTGGIVLNEIFEASNNAEEWIELYNKSDSPVDVSGWKIADDDSGGTDIFPTVSPIPADGYGVIVTSNTTVSIPISAISINLDSTTIGGSGLNSEGEPLYLRNTTDIVVDSMSYGNSTLVFPTPPAAPSPTQSIARIPNGEDTNSASNWTLDNSPTLGTVNSL